MTEKETGGSIHQKSICHEPALHSIIYEVYDIIENFNVYDQAAFVGYSRIFMGFSSNSLIASSNFAAVAPSISL